MNARSACILSVALLLAGCVNLAQEAPEKTRYVLDAQRPGAGQPLDAGRVRVGRFRVGSAFERKGLVYRTSDTTFESDFYHEFYSPPGLLVRQLAGAWISDSAVFTSVLGSSDPVASDWLLEGRVNNLFADLRDPDDAKAIMEVELFLLDAMSVDRDVVFRKRYRRAVPAPNPEPAALVDAWSEALTKIFTAFESDLREQLAALPKKKRRR